MNIFWTLGHKVELDEMLAGRESRAKLQRQMLEFCDGATLICFTLNIAGPMKVTALTDEAFYEGVAAIEESLMMAGINAESEIAENPYGHEAYYVIDQSESDAMDVKRLMVMIEEEHPMGRLFDIDVMRLARASLQRNDSESVGASADSGDASAEQGGASDDSGTASAEQGGASAVNDATNAAGELHKISRTDIGEAERRCLICDKPAAVCASTRAHSVSELQTRTTEMIAGFLKSAEPTAGTISRMAYNSMMNEVATTPKPGLVDFDNNGAHDDMTPELFEKSAQAIKDFFGDIFDIGMASASEPAEALLAKVRPLGVATENKMLAETGGVNTHKGMIFSLGLICLAWGYLSGKAEATRTGASAATIEKEDMVVSESMIGASAKETITLENIFYVASMIAAPTMSEPNERGGGARAEAQSGFKSIREVALPAFDKASAAGLDINTCGVYTLIKLIGEVEDTNMVARGGGELAVEMREKARRLAGEFESELRIVECVGEFNDNNSENGVEENSGKNSGVASENGVEENSGKNSGVDSENGAEENSSKNSDVANENAVEADLQKLSDEFIRKVFELDDEFIEKNVSPGGCADLLAITYFCKMMQDILRD